VGITKAGILQFMAQRLLRKTALAGQRQLANVDHGFDAVASEQGGKGSKVNTLVAYRE
jgi:hypothetical protein